MSIDHTEPVEKYIILAMYGGLFALHVTMFVNFLQEPLIPAAITYGQGGLLVVLAGILVWLVRDPW